MSRFAKLTAAINKAKGNPGALRRLNFMLGFGIPFNRPHGFKIKEIGEDYVKTYAPYKRKNFNHIRGIHACGIATISEFATGMLLLSKVDPAKYRLIMSEMRMEYFYQAKKPLIATSSLTEEELQMEIIQPLSDVEVIFRTQEVRVEDIEGNHVATGHITWQIKEWAKVRTKVS